MARSMTRIMLAVCALVAIYGCEAHRFGFGPPTNTGTASQCNGVSAATQIPGTVCYATDSGNTYVAKGNAWVIIPTGNPAPIFWASLASASPNSRDTRTLDGYASTQDGGGGIVVWNASSTKAPDSCTVSAGPAGTGSPGRWERPLADYVNVLWCGAQATGRVTLGGFDNTSAFTNAINAANTQGKLLFIPPQPQHYGFAASAASTDPLPTITTGIMSGPSKNTSAALDFDNTDGDCIKLRGPVVIISGLYVTNFRAPNIGPVVVANVFDAGPPIGITTSTAHGLDAGMSVWVSNVLGTSSTPTLADGVYSVTNAYDSTHLALDASAGATFGFNDAGGPGSLSNNFTTNPSYAIHVMNVQGANGVNINANAGTGNNGDLAFEQRYDQAAITSTGAPSSGTITIVLDTSAWTSEQKQHALPVTGEQWLFAGTGNASINSSQGPPGTLTGPFTITVTAQTSTSTTLTIPAVGSGSSGVAGNAVRFYDAYYLCHIGNWYNVLDSIHLTYLGAANDLGYGLSLIVNSNANSVINAIGCVTTPVSGASRNNHFRMVDIESQARAINLSGAVGSKIELGGISGAIDIYGRGQVQSNKFEDLIVSNDQRAIDCQPPGCATNQYLNLTSSNPGTNGTYGPAAGGGYSAIQNAIGTQPSWLGGSFAWPWAAVVTGASYRTDDGLLAFGPNTHGYEGFGVSSQEPSGVGENWWFGTRTDNNGFACSYVQTYALSPANNNFWMCAEATGTPFVNIQSPDQSASLYLGSSIANIGGAVQGPGAATPFQWGTSNFTIGGSGTTTLTGGGASAQTPRIVFLSQTLSGSATMSFGGVVGQFFLDMTNLNLAGNKLVFSNGSGSVQVDGIIAAKRAQADGGASVGLIVYCGSANAITVF